MAEELIPDPDGTLVWFPAKKRLRYRHLQPNLLVVAESLTPRPFFVGNSISRLTMSGVLRGLRRHQELGPEKITVNVVSPGPTDTELFGQGKTE